MVELTDPIKLIIVFIIGAVIGLERETSEGTMKDTKKDLYAPLGLRTGALIATLGAITGMLFHNYLPMAILIASLFGILLVTFYVIHSLITKDIGTTTELSLIYIFVIGFIIYLEVIPIQLSLAIAVVLMILLSQKQRIKAVVKDVRRQEISAFASYGVIALVILPFLPNETYALADLPFIQSFAQDLTGKAKEIVKVEFLNPFKLWLIVALITGIDILGYILERTLGQKRGWLVASIAGGFVSSTAVTLSLAQQSKKTKAINPLLSAALFANLASFFQVAIIIAAISTAFFIYSIPIMFAIVLAALATGLYFHFSGDKKSKTLSSKKNIQSHEIINLWPAIRFALIFTAINLISKISLILFGTGAFLLTTALGSLPGIDAVVINIATLAGKEISLQLAGFALILANGVNLASKSIYSFIQGERRFAIRLAISMTIIIIFSLIGWSFTLILA